MIIINKNYDKQFSYYINEAAIKYNVSTNKAKEIVDAVLDSAVDDLIDGKRITIPKIGSFSIKETKQHGIKDINTGMYRILPAKKRVKYNPNSWITTRINE